MRYVALVLTLLFVASPGRGGVDYLDVRAGLVNYYPSVETWGQARSMSNSGEVVPATMTGAHVLGVTGSSGCCVSDAHNVAWATATGAWADTTYVGVYDGYCYRTSISAYSGSLSQGAGSSQICFDSAPPPPTTSLDTSELCPLVLDLNGDGVHTTGLENPVRFWTLEGTSIASGWTDPETDEAFLWIDLESDHHVIESELFGSRMEAPGGGVHRNGFQALAKYDELQYGGDGDAAITANDRVWGRLRLWVDRDHDGIAAPHEISSVGAHGIVALNLQRVHDHRQYANGNSLMLVGSYVVRERHGLRELPMVDVGFIYAP